MSENIAESAERVAVHPSHMIFDLQRSHDWQGEANYKADRSLYNVIDWRGEFRGQIALTREEALLLNPLGAGVVQ